MPRFDDSRRSFLAALAGGLAAWPGEMLAAKDGGLEPVLARLRARSGLPALAACAFTSRRILAEAVSGVRLRGTAAVRTTLDDQFHLASLTKSMTAVLAGQMVEKGRLRWETTLGEALRGFPMHEKARRVTLWQLLRHRSGLAREIPDALYERLKRGSLPPQEQRRQVARAMLSRPPLREPEAAHEYSNFGYVLAGLMLEAAAGQSWETLMHSRLFGPLGLKSGGFGPPALDPKKVGQPWGHRADGGAVLPGPLARHVPAIAPAGGVHLSVRDFARYAQWHLREAAPRPALVSSVTLRRLHGEGQPDGYYGGWERAARTWAGGQSLTHKGSTGLFFAVAWLAPERDFGVVAVCNQGGGKSADACDSACAHLIARHAGA